MTEDELNLLSDSAARLASAVDHRADESDRDVWRQFGAQGWLSIMTPAEHGGFGEGLEAAAAVSKQLGRCGLRSPFVAAGVLAPACLAKADESETWLEHSARVLSGEVMVTVAWQGARGSLDPLQCEVRGSSRGRDVVLKGASRLVPASGADAFLVLARGPQGCELYWVDRGEKGLSVKQEQCADGSNLGWLTFDDVVISSAARLVGSSNALGVLNDALDGALIASAAELAGIVEETLEMTLGYLRERRQFGATIGSFQALQHRAVDMYVQHRVVAAATAAAARAFDAAPFGSPSRSLAAAGAKARAGSAALGVCSEALQLHGAIGFADEYGLGRYFNRALVLSAWLGEAAYHQRRYGELTANANMGGAR